MAQTTTTIMDVTPTWTQMLGSLIMLIEHSNTEGRKTAIDELKRMADLADRYASTVGKPNSKFVSSEQVGMEEWAETHYQVVSRIENSDKLMDEMDNHLRKESGIGACMLLAYGITERFHEKYPIGQHDWDDADWLETLDAFIDEEFAKVYANTDHEL